MRLSRLALALPIVFVLAGCNETTGMFARAPDAAVPFAGAATEVAEGRGCAAEIARYQAVTKSDADTGNVNKSVYQQIEAETARASAACSAGREGEAMGLLRASQSRHGYRTS